MNSQNPWTSLLEVLLLLGVGFFVGYLGALGRYIKQIRTQKLQIIQLQKKLKRSDAGRKN